MHAGVPSRFRHPLHDPDPVIARQYRVLFDGPLMPAHPAQVDLLAASLMRGDPAADEWLRYVREQRGPLRDTARSDDPEQLFERALSDGIDAIADAPAPLIALLRQTEVVPLWVDEAMLRDGACALRRTGLFGHIVLAHFGLMGGYRSATVAKSLTLTGRLRYGAPERLIETGRFITRVTEPGALLPHLDGYRAALKVRLVHAHVRHALALSPAWSVEHDGIPINQADMLATNLLFSVGLVVGCRALGFRFTPDEKLAIVHLWRYAGYLLGIDEALLPADWPSGLRALYLVSVSQPDPTEDSVELARALHHIPLTFAKTPLRRKLANVQMDIRASLTRALLGDEAADQLKLPKSRVPGVVPALVSVIRTAERVRELLPGADRAALRAGDRLLKAAQASLDAELKAAKQRDRAA